MGLYTAELYPTIRFRSNLTSDVNRGADIKARKRLVYKDAADRRRRMDARKGGLSASANGSLRPDIARAAFEKRWFAGLDDLPEEERARRALARRRLYFVQLSQAGLQARGLLSDPQPEEAHRD